MSPLKPITQYDMQHNPAAIAKLASSRLLHPCMPQVAACMSCYMSASGLKHRHRAVWKLAHPMATKLSKPLNPNLFRCQSQHLCFLPHSYCLCMHVHPEASMLQTRVGAPLTHCIFKKSEAAAHPCHKGYLVHSRPALPLHHARPRCPAACPGCQRSAARRNRALWPRVLACVSVHRRSDCRAPLAENRSLDFVHDAYEPVWNENEVLDIMHHAHKFV